MSRSAHAIAGVFVLGIVDLLINLLSAAIQQRAFFDQFDTAAVIGLAVFAVLGLLMGYWLGGRVDVPTPPPAGAPAATSKDETSITRLRALLSYAELHGRGVHLSDILLIGSRIKIDTKD